MGTRAQNKAWKLANPDKVLEAQKRFRQRPDIRQYDRNQNFKSKYGITIKDYDSLLIQQDGHCGFPGCLETESVFDDENSRRLAVDHDHETGKIRSLLCQRHNFLIGHARDSVEELESAITYLQSFGKLTKERTNGF